MPRRLELAEVDNIRDLGGLPVRGGGTTRRGVVFRASRLQEATTGDVALLLGRYRLRTVGRRPMAGSVAFGTGRLS